MFFHSIFHVRVSPLNLPHLFPTKTPLSLSLVLQVRSGEDSLEQALEEFLDLRSFLLTLLTVQTLAFTGNVVDSEDWTILWSLFVQLLVSTDEEGPNVNVLAVCKGVPGERTHLACR